MQSTCRQRQRLLDLADDVPPCGRRRWPRPMSEPTLVAMTTSSCRPRRAIQRPMIAADSPPLCPGTQREYEFCGVDQVEAGVDAGVEQRERRRLVRRPAEHVAAERERRDREAGTAEESAFPWPIPRKGSVFGRDPKARDERCPELGGARQHQGVRKNPAHCNFGDDLAQSQLHCALSNYSIANA